MSTLTQPVRIIATAFVPDRGLGLPGREDAGRLYTLILQGDFLYVVVQRNVWQTPAAQQAYLNSDPVEFLLQRYFDITTPGAADAEGRLFFREEDEVALSWFTEEFEKRGGTITLVLET